MERMAWTDERLDDLARRVDAGFERIDAGIRELRRELRTDMGSMRAELRGEIDRLRLAMIRVGGTGFLGVIAAILARG